MSRAERITTLHAAARERILVLDGSWGVMIQRRALAEADFRGARFAAHAGQMKGNNDILCLTRPDVVADLHDRYFAAGADISETNTFSATTIAQEDYGLDEQAVWDINLEGAKLARAAADRWTAQEPHKPRFAAGSIGPLNKMLSMSSDVNDPGARSVTFDQVYAAYRQQARALHEGGVDLFLIETITDTLNCKAAIKAILDLEDEGLEPLPMWISGTIVDRSGAHPERADGRGLLEQRAACEAVRGRIQLRPGRRADAAVHRRAEPRGRHPGRRLSQRRPAQRHGRL
jgi:5-methyltetrahydrofolate--homocysteine methyltransferase